MADRISDPFKLNCSIVINAAVLMVLIIESFVSMLLGIIYWAPQKFLLISNTHFVQ